MTDAEKIKMLLNHIKDMERCRADEDESGAGTDTFWRGYDRAMKIVAYHLR